MVDEEELGALGGGELEKLGMSRYSSGERGYLLWPGYLKAVGAVVLESAGLQELVDLSEDVEEPRGHDATIAVWNTGGASGRGAAW
jgi:hypothetical protein